MKHDLILLELPAKYAMLAFLIFIVSSYSLGYLYEYVATAAIGIDGPLSQARESGGFSMDRAVRYLFFFFFVFLGIVCYVRTSLRTSMWGIFFLLVFMPSILTSLPFLMTTGFQVSPLWGLCAVIIGLMCIILLSDDKNEAVSRFLLLLVAMTLLYAVIKNVITWSEHVHKAMVSLHGDSEASLYMKSAIWYVLPVAVLDAFVSFYFIYILPRKFISNIKTKIIPLST